MNIHWCQLNYNLMPLMKFQHNYARSLKVVEEQNDQVLTRKHTMFHMLWDFHTLAPNS